MHSLREALGFSSPPSPGLLQVVDALILYDAPLLDQRFQEAIAMHPDADMRAALAALPPRVAEGSRLTRRGAIEWERISGNSLLDADFRCQAERFLLEAFLDSAEAQIKLKVFMARHAPTRDVRKLIDDAIAVHRELTTALRLALSRLGEDVPTEGAQSGTYVAAEGPSGELRGQVEAAIRRMQATGKRPRVLMLSANALRHLRDQGLFRGGEPNVMGVPVHVDFTWPGATFALMSFDSAALDEIIKKD